MIHCVEYRSFTWLLHGDIFRRRVVLRNFLVGSIEIARKLFHYGDLIAGGSSEASVSHFFSVFCIIILTGIG